MEGKLRIVTQNLNKADISWIERYKEKVNADIYAFQEIKKGTAGITDIHISNNLPDDTLIQIEAKSLEAEENWNNVFNKTGKGPWFDFRDGFWKEATLTYKNGTIKIINIHLSNYSNEQFRFLLTKYLYDLEKSFENVLLLGDFNTAEYNQTMKPNTWAQAMYHTITDIFGYKELFSENEKPTEPHYTFCEYKQQKIDHIFVSPKLYIKLREWGFRVRYIDEVNINKDKLQNINEDSTFFGIKPFTDHSGILLEIGHRKES